MPTIVDLGKSIKQHYPGTFDDIPDADLGSRVKQKYAGKFDDFTDAASPTGAGPTATDPKKKGGFLGAVGSIGKTLSNVGMGAMGDIAKAGIGLGQLAVKGVKGVVDLKTKYASPMPVDQKIGKSVSGFLGKTINEQENIKGRFDTPETKTTAGKIGGFVGDVALLSSPEVIKPQEAAKTAIKGSAAIGALKEAPGAVKPLSYLAQKVLLSIPSGVTGTLFGGVKGESAKGAVKTGATFAAMDVASQIFGDAWKSIKGDIDKNLGRVFRSVSDKEKSQALSAMKSYADLKDEIKVGTEDAPREFVPSKATFGDMVQATPQVKQHLYETYSEIAQNAGDNGAKFTEKDFNKIITSLKEMQKDSGPGFKNSANQWIDYIQQNFGKPGLSDEAAKVIEMMNKEGMTDELVTDPALSLQHHPMTNELKLSPQVTQEVDKFLTEVRNGTREMTDVPQGTSFDDVDFARMQKFLEKVNTGVNPLSDKPGAETALSISKNIRDVMDDKISSSTGEEYQAVRNQYAAVKSVEKQLEKLARQYAARGGQPASGFNRLMERFGTVDVLAGLLTHGTSEMIRGAGLVASSELSRYLSSNQTALQSLFKAIESAGKVGGPTAGKTLGKAVLQAGAARMVGGPTK